MPRYFAFLRAINVGKRLVRMETLRELFTGLGFSLVETFINSGNVIFETRSVKTADLEKRIAKHLETNLGYAVPTFLRTDTELAAISVCQPFDPALARKAATLCVGFLAEGLTAAQHDSLMALQTSDDFFHVQDREIYWLSLKKQSESVISNAVLERKLKVPFTFRNLTTVGKLLERYR